MTQEIYSHGSIAPTICFCLTNPPLKLLDFIRKYQIKTPIFRDSMEDHRLTCETIIRTDNLELYKEKLIGIDDCYIFEGLRVPFHNRSVINLYYQGKSDAEEKMITLDDSTINKINLAIKDIVYENVQVPYHVYPFMITINETHNKMRQTVIEETSRENCKVIDTSPVENSEPSLL